jgi:hypothetical protein
VVKSIVIRFYEELGFKDKPNRVREEIISRKVAFIAIVFISL